MLEVYYSIADYRIHCISFAYRLEPQPIGLVQDLFLEMFTDLGCLLQATYNLISYMGADIRIDLRW